VWIQLAGFTEEHLAMLRFSYSNSTLTTSIEKSSCMGKMWNYNLYDLRPEAKFSFLSQMTGSKNMSGSCNDFKQRPFWYYLREKIKPSVAMIEIGADKEQSISYAEYMCGARSPGYFGSTSSVVLMSKPFVKKPKFFHFQEQAELAQGEIYFDKTCSGKKGCYASLINNAKELYQRLIKRKDGRILIIRDYRFANAIKSKNMKRAREILMEVEKIHEYFSSQFKRSRDKLLLVSGGAAQSFEFPSQGKDWSAFEKKGRKVLYRKQSLMSPIFAQGASAQNFCGVYEESEVLSRILFVPANRGLRIF
jgi:hypothetical protein